jgi:hypothetical protein
MSLRSCPFLPRFLLAHRALVDRYLDYIDFVDAFTSRAG